ncbi:MAG: hypothetical protein ABIH03_08855 [Pseudomonadota bacterium]
MTSENNTTEVGVIHDKNRDEVLAILAELNKRPYWLAMEAHQARICHPATVTKWLRDPLQGISSRISSPVLDLAVKLRAEHRAEATKRG